MRLGYEPRRATCLVVKYPDDELSTQLRHLWRSKFQPQQNVRVGQKEESAKRISDKHPHGKLLNILQHGKWPMETKCTPCSGMWSNNGQIVYEELHSSFYDMFSKPMVTIVLCGKTLYDQEMICERMMVLMSSNRSVPTDTCMITDIVF